MVGRGPKEIQSPHQEPEYMSAGPLIHRNKQTTKALYWRDRSTRTNESKKKPSKKPLDWGEASIYVPVFELPLVDIDHLLDSFPYLKMSVKSGGGLRLS